LSSVLLKNKPVLLIVDDDPTQRLIMEAVLRDLEVEIREASDGSEALTMFEECRPALVIMDIMMPGVDGYEACRLMRALPGGDEAVIVLMTGLDNIEALDKAYEVGAADFATKPINPVIIRQRAQYQLRSWEFLKELRASEQRLSRAQSIARVGDWEMALDEERIRGSAQCCEILGLDDDALDATYGELLSLVHPEDRSLLMSGLRNVVYNVRDLSLKHRLKPTDAGTKTIHQRAVAITDNAGQVIGVSGIMQDVTSEKQAKDRISKLANMDELTGMLNRRSFREAARTALRRALVREVGLAVLLLDLDRFRSLNARVGYEAGDEIMRCVARRVSEVVANTEKPSGAVWEPTLARLGDDEIVVLAEGYEQPAAVRSLAEALLSAVVEGADASTHDVSLTASMGIALGPADGTDVDALLTSADAAMAQAKAAGGGRCLFTGDPVADAVAVENVGDF